MKLDKLDKLVTFWVNHKITPCNHQLNATKSLRNNPEIMVKPTDQGSPTVDMSRDAHIKEVERQLGNRKHYTKLSEPVYPVAAGKIIGILKKLEGSDYIRNNFAI